MYWTLIMARDLESKTHDVWRKRETNIQNVYVQRDSETHVGQVCVCVPVWKRETETLFWN